MIRYNFITTIFCFIISIALVLSQYLVANAEMVYVQTDKSQVFEKPNEKSRTLWELGKGFPVDAKKKSGDWIYFKDFENDSGWIKKIHLAKGSFVIIKANKSQDKAVNIRDNPTTDSSIIGNAFYGVVFQVLNKKGAWLNIQHESGLKGWIKSEFVWGL
jgi:SH3-like domain-containing protein